MLIVIFDSLSHILYCDTQVKSTNSSEALHLRLQNTAATMRIRKYGFTGLVKHLHTRTDISDN